MLLPSIGTSSNGRTTDSGSVSGSSILSVPAILHPMARSSSGLGRRPLKAEITGSNPVRATKPSQALRGLFSYTYDLATSFPELLCRAPTWVRAPTHFVSRCMRYRIPSRVLMGEHAGNRLQTKTFTPKGHTSLRGIHRGGQDEVQLADKRAEEQDCRREESRGDSRDGQGGGLRADKRGVRGHLWGSFWMNEYYCPMCGSHDVGVWQNSNSGHCYNCDYRGPFHQFSH